MMEAVFENIREKREKMTADAHIHIFMNGYDYRKAVRDMREGRVEDVVRQNLETYAGMGFELLRDGGDHYGASALAKGLAPSYGLDYRTPLFAIHKRNHYGRIVGEAFDTLSEYRSLVQKALFQGADFIKIMVSGILDFDKGGLTEGSLAPDEIEAMIAIAHEEGAAVMVHTNGPEAVKAVVRAEAESLEHGNFMDEECIDLLAKSRTVYVPTLSTLRNLIGEGRFPDRITGADWESQVSVIRSCYEAGARLAVGSDAGAYAVPHGKGALDEKEAFYRILGKKEAVDRRLEEGMALIREFSTR